MYDMLRCSVIEGSCASVAYINFTGDSGSEFSVWGSGSKYLHNTNKIQPSLSQLIVMSSTPRQVGDQSKTALK